MLADGGSGAGSLVRTAAGAMAARRYVAQPELEETVTMESTEHEMNVGRTLVILVAFGLLFSGLWMGWWFTGVLEASGGPDRNRSLLEYALPYVIAGGFVVGGILLLRRSIRDRNNQRY